MLITLNIQDLFLNTCFHFFYTYPKIPRFTCLCTKCCSGEQIVDSSEVIPAILKGNSKITLSVKYWLNSFVLKVQIDSNNSSGAAYASI